MIYQQQGCILGAKAILCVIWQSYFPSKIASETLFGLDKRDGGEWLPSSKEIMKRTASD
jgi:hypothetical protein